MMFRNIQESGTNEDQLCLAKHKRIQVVDDEAESLLKNRGIHKVDKTSAKISAFLSEVSALCGQTGQHGLIWDDHLSPSGGCYDLGEHYSKTGEKPVKSAHSWVTFHRDGETGHKFAIKTLQSHESFNAKEVQIGLEKGHPNICSVYGIIVRSGEVQIIMEHSGASLLDHRQWLSSEPSRMIEAAKQCFNALAYLASLKLVHCDVKPDNITVVREGNNFTLKLVDFGTCSSSGHLLSERAHTTQEYWAPEVWQAVEYKKDIQLDPAFDVYSMALTLYFIQTSYHLTQRIQDVKEVMLKEPGMVQFLALPDSLPADLRVVLKACLNEVPDRRLTADQALQRLQDKEESFPRGPSSGGHIEASAASPDTVNYLDSWQTLKQHVAQPGFTTTHRADLVSVEQLKERYRTVSLGKELPLPNGNSPASSTMRQTHMVVPSETGFRARGATTHKHPPRVQKPRMKGKAPLKGTTKGKTSKGKSGLLPKEKGKTLKSNNSNVFQQMVLEEQGKKMDPIEYHCSNTLMEFARKAQTQFSQNFPSEKRKFLPPEPELSNVKAHSVIKSNKPQPSKQAELFRQDVRREPKLSTADIAINPLENAAKVPRLESMTHEMSEPFQLESDSKEDIDYIVEAIDGKAWTDTSDISDFLYKEVLRMEQGSERPTVPARPLEEAMEIEELQPSAQTCQAQNTRIYTAQTTNREEQDIAQTSLPITPDSNVSGPNNVPDFSQI